MTDCWKAWSLALFALGWGVAPLHSANALKWNNVSGMVDATVDSWTVPELLQHVATATGWQILLDPAITNRIPAKFVNKTPGDALRRLLGENNYALVPETNSPSRLFVFRNSREQATRVIQPAASTADKPGKSRILNELVVTLKPGEKIEDLAKKLGAKIIGRSDGQNTYRLRFEDEAAAQLARETAQNDPAVENIDSNYSIGRQEVPQALGTPGGVLPLTPKASPDGKYTVIGLIDSAVQARDGNFTDFVLPAIVVQGDGKSTDSTPTHGTSMSETILRGLSSGGDESATTVRILPVDVYGISPTTSTYDIAVGIYKAVNAGAMIVNLSLGGDGDSSFLHTTITSAHDQGVVFVGAAGNEPVKTPNYPAAYPEVIAVTASDRNGNLASYANRGDFVDAIAPGGSLITFRGQQYYVIGTSASTAYASGLAGAIMESTKRTGVAVESALQQALAPKK